jgi:hypothetical protein
VLDFVPTCWCRAQVTDCDVEGELVGQLLQLAFPQPYREPLRPPPSAVISNRVASDSAPDRR